MMILDDERRDVYFPLTDSGVPALARGKLAALGITTLQELRDAWTYGNRRSLADYLGESPDRFTAFRLARSLPIPGVLGHPSPLVKKPRGLALSLEQEYRPASAPLPVGQPEARAERTVSLVDRFPAPRDQRSRGTCVAFASVALLEYHLYDVKPSLNHHSEQFVFWACKQSDGDPDDDSTSLDAAMFALKTRGACLSKTWPYDGLPGARVDQGPAPAKSIKEAKKYLYPSPKIIPNALFVEGMQNCLDAGRPIVLGVQTFPSWDYPTVAETGEIFMPPPETLPDGGHAVCVVGYELRGDVAGGGAFIFRNSWGRT